MSTLHLTGTQRKHLRGLAHSLQPVVHVGKAGLSEALVAGIDEALTDHELIKVRFVDGKERKKELCAEIDELLGCQTVGLVGHVAILYRPAAEQADRQIRLPDP